MTRRSAAGITAAASVVALLLSACSRTQPPPAPPLVLEGFESRESVGSDPVFDLSAKRAVVMGDVQRPARPDTSPASSAISALMRVEGVKFTLFRNGVKSGIVTAREGLFHARDKTVDLSGGVHYISYTDSVHVSADRMAWNPATSVLHCETDVRGAFHLYRFSSASLDLHRTKNVLLLRDATFSGPG